LSLSKFVYKGRVDECKQKDAPRFEKINRNQVVPAPLDVEKLIPLDHPARNLWEFLGGLDLNQFSNDIKSVEGSAGRNAWDPRLLIATWLYACSRGICSARQIERECEYEPGLRSLTGLAVINHHTLSDLRVRHGEALQELFIQVPGILMMEKLITLERVTVDGTKVRACASKKTFGRADKIHEHMRLARNHLKQLQEQEGMAIFKLRSPVAEFPHAWLKDKLKWVRVRTRGLMKVAAEALRVSLVHNLQRYFALKVLLQSR
jgi:transposase